jgi:hypothetical protein
MPVQSGTAVTGTGPIHARSSFGTSERPCRESAGPATSPPPRTAAVNPASPSSRSSPASTRVHSYGRNLPTKISPPSPMVPACSTSCDASGMVMKYRFI